MSARKFKPVVTTFSTYGQHIDKGMRGTLVMFERPTPEERALLVLPFTYCPNVASLLDESNWATIQRELETADPEGNDHSVASFGHWATAYDLMRVKAGTEAHAVAERLMARLEDYPVLNESDYSDRETEAFSDDLTRVLNGLTIVVNGVELGSDGPEYDALFCALDSEMNESEKQDSCDCSDVEEALRDLGFEYDATEFTWTGTLAVEES